MSLLSKLVGELVDIVEYPDAPPGSLVYRFPRYQNQIKYGAKLIVREGQGAIFVNEGKLAEVFAPGTYTLETRNLPILSSLQGWKYGFTSPFKAEVYFFTTKPVLNQQWGTQQAITMDLPGYGLGEVRAYGQTSYRISDPETFFRQMVGTTGILTDSDLLDYLRGLVMSQFSQALTASHPTVEQLLGNLNALDDTLQGDINLKLKPLGFELTQFLIENLSLPPELRDEIFEYSRLNKVDIGKLTQLQAAKSITVMAGSTDGGGVGGQGMQLGLGMAVAAQVAKSLGAAFSAGDMGAVPPPLPGDAPQAAYHVALNGKPQGPFPPATLASMAAASSIDAHTLVWRPGLTGWGAAGAQADLKPLFPEEPPPLP
jgi:membrane protease subunit (stomatin/prohibitin family)